MTLDHFWHRVLRRPYLLHSTAHGPADKPVIVMLHGIAASSDDWGKLVPLLSKQYRCVTIDLLGFAKSPKPQWANYTMEDHVRSIAYTIKKLELQGPITLIGHSLGSLLATRYARLHAREVNRLLLLSPPVYPPLKTIQTKAAYYRTSWLMKLYRFLRTHPRMTPATMKKISYIVPLPRSITKYPETWLPFHRSLERCIEQQTIERDIIEIRAPIDIFYGTLDTLVVGPNVKMLVHTDGVHVHTFRGQHSISQAYAKLVSKALLEPVEKA